MLSLSRLMRTYYHPFSEQIGGLETRQREEKKKTEVIFLIRGDVSSHESQYALRDIILPAVICPKYCKFMYDEAAAPATISPPKFLSLHTKAQSF